jgi:alpha-glucosidase
VGDGLRRQHHQPAANPRGRYCPAWHALKVTLPAGEKRKLLINGEEAGEWRLK